MNYKEWQKRAILLMRITVSGSVLVTAFLIILSNNYPDSYIKWAFGIIGVVVGYWLR